MAELAALDKNMSTPAVPSPTCQISWIENGQLVTDGMPTVVVAFLYYQQQSAQPSLAPMVSMCQSHYEQLNPREYMLGLWSYVPLTSIPAGTARKVDIQAPAKLDPGIRPTFINPGQAAQV